MTLTVDWRVREAGADDISALSLVGAATFLETFAGILAGHGIVDHCGRAHSPAAYAQYFADGARAWLAEVPPSGGPIGFGLIARPDLPGARAGDIELKRIYTLSRFHGAGVGAALMEAAVTAAAGHQRLLLGAYRGNERAIAFYRKNGFEQIGERKFDVGGTLYDDVVLARTLVA